MSKQGGSAGRNSDPGYLVTALCHIGDFQGGECLIYLSTTSIAVCARNGRAVGSWPYNVIRDFSCRDGNFSFTSGRRGPFGVGTYQFQPTPSVLTKLTSAVTMITGAQFGRTASPEQYPKHHESPSPDHPSTPDQHSALIDQATISNGSYGDHSSPKVHEGNMYDRLAKPLHSSYSSSELKTSCAVQPQSPHPFKKQMSSPGPVRHIKRPRHHYEEIDLPGTMRVAAGSPLSLACTLPSSPTTPSLANSATCLGSLCTGPSHDCSPAELLGTLPGSTVSAVYENVRVPLARDGPAAEPRALAAGCVKRPLHHPVECGRKDVVVPRSSCGDDCHVKCEGHCGGSTCGPEPDNVATCKQTGCVNNDMYDRPHSSLYSVPARHDGDGEVLTLNARRGCSRIPPLALSTEGGYYNMQSLKSCHWLAEDQDGLYEEIDSALGCPRQRGPQLRHLSPDCSHSGCKPKYDVSASVIARQLATEEGYELVTSMRHAVSHKAGNRLVESDHSSLSDMEQGGPEQLYVNQNFHKEELLAKDAGSNEESDDYVVISSPNTPPTRVLAGNRYNQEHGACHVSGPRRAPRRMFTNTVDLVPTSECIAF